MQQAHKQFGARVGSLKGTSTGERVGKDPAQLKACPPPCSAPLANVDSTSAKQALKCALLKGCRVPCIVLRLTVLPTKHPGTCSSLPLTLSLILSPSHTEPLTVF